MCLILCIYVISTLCAIDNDDGRRAERTRVGVPVVLVVRADLLAHELLVDDFLELDHFDRTIYAS